MNKKLFFGLVVVVLAVAGGYYYLQAMREKNEIVPLKIAWADAPSNRFIVAVMKDQGFDKKHNLDLEVVWSDPGENIRQLINKVGGVEVGTFPALALIDANKQGAKLRAFAPQNYGGGDIVVKADSPYKKLSDLKGTKVAIRPKVSAAYKNLALNIKLAGFDAEKDFKLIFGAIADNIISFNKGDADSTVLSGLTGVEIRANPKYRVLAELDAMWLEETGFRNAFSTISAHEDWINSHQQTMLDLRAAYLETTNFILNNHGVLDTYAELLGIKTPAGRKVAERDLERVIAASWDPESHIATIKKAVELGLSEDFPVETLFVK